MKQKLIFIFLGFLMGMFILISPSLSQDNFLEKWRQRREERREERKGKIKDRILDKLKEQKSQAKTGVEMGPNDHVFTIEHDGYSREFYIHVPKAYREDVPSPMIINYHGGGGSIKSVKNESLMDQSSEKDGYIVAYPVALKSGAGAARWNNGPRTDPGKQGISDDVGFTRKMIAMLETNFNIDSDRIYATGISNGGMMTYRLACELSDKIAAFAPIGTALVMEDCQPSWPVSLIHIHGKKDPLILYEGGNNPDAPQWWRDDQVYRSAQESIDVFRKNNHCPNSSQTTYQNGEATCRTYGPCDEGTEVVLCSIEDGGHTWPGGAYPVDKKWYHKLVGKLSFDLNANKMMWDFFQKHPLKRDKVLVSSLGPGDHFFSFEDQGVTRQYYVYMPFCYDGSQPVPLVLNFHGGGGSAEGHRDMTGMDTVAEKECFAVAYPRGLRTDADTKRKFKRFWNVPNGPAGVYNSDPLITRMDDAVFVNQMIDDITSKFRIDKNRIYATGLSNGGVLSHELACQLSEHIAAISSVSGPFWSYPQTCQPKRPVPFMYFHGTADVCAPYEGGPAGCEAKIAGSGRVFISAQETVDIWRGKNNCVDQSEITYQNGDVTCRTYSRCAEGSEVVFCSIDGGGHTWPGGKGYKIPGFDIGPVTKDINASDAMWEFFERHPMRK